jgi:hypothetical protein
MRAQAGIHAIGDGRRATHKSIVVVSHRLLL